jgi:methylated-DNA-protein-cysteine methyltransferase-like protein
MDNISPEERLYTALASVPIGTTIAYGELASVAGFPGRARWVGRMLSQLPGDTQLPWHRVTNAQRRISFPLGSDRFIEQSIRLQREGLQISSTGKVSLPN